MGPRPAAEADQRCRELMKLGRADPHIEAHGCCMRAVLTAMRGDFDEARSLRDRGRRMTEELGVPLHRAGLSMMLGYVDELAGDEGAAEAEYRIGYDLSRAIGETGYLSTTAYHLARVAHAQGSRRRGAPAERGSGGGRLIRRCHDADRLEGGARLRFRRPRDGGAGGAARAGGGRAARPGDTIDERANTLNTLGEVLDLAGTREDARTAFAEALALWQQKGNAASAARARARIGRARRASRSSRVSRRRISRACPSRDEHGRGARDRVVVRAHRERVGASRGNGQ